MILLMGSASLMPYTLAHVINPRKNLGARHSRLWTISDFLLVGLILEESLNPRQGSIIVHHVAPSAPAPLPLRGVRRSYPWRGRARWQSPVLYGPAPADQSSH